MAHSSGLHKAAVPCDGGGGDLKGRVDCLFPRLLFMSGWATEKANDNAC